ncbi:MAG: trigger factor [Acidobacteria bacterium]|nr:trigger factor [Acidobacteriota bacterium]
MKTEVKEISPTQRELHIEVDAASLKDAYDKISRRYAKGASVPGFRKGYAPLDVIRIRYKEEIKQEVLQLLIPDKVTAAITEHGLQPLAEPHLHLDDIENAKVNGSQSIKVHAHIEVMPELPEPKYKGIELVRRVKPVDDAEVESLIEERLQGEAALIPVEGRPSKKGDTVVVDLEGKFDDDPDGDPITASDLEITLGAENIDPSFTENLEGVNEDDEKEFSVSYAEDFSSNELAGKTVHYKASVKSVGVMEKPEPNDEWAQSLDEGYESLADLRKKLRADLETYAKSQADARLRNEAVEKLIADNTFEVPNALIENQARNLLNNFAQDLQRQGVDLNNVQNDFIQMAFTQMRSQAERDVRGAMLLEKVAEAEKVVVEKEEIENEIAQMAEYYRVTPDEIRESLEKQGGSGTIENNLRTKKSIEALIENARITDGEWEDERLAAEPNAETEEKPKKKAKAKAKEGEKPEAAKEKKPAAAKKVAPKKAKKAAE